MIDFSNITACGGDCTGCEYFRNNVCRGCSTNSGKCVKMWENGCEICRCCKSHNVKFCGLCGEFPCEWLKRTLIWDKEGIRTCLHKILHASFRQILPMTALEILEIHQVFLRFSALSSTKFARKSTHKSYEDRFLKRLSELKKEYSDRSDIFSMHLPELWEKIGTHKIMVLSTCCGNRVTSRSMSVVVNNGKFYCQTDEHYLKYRQISKNPNIALCFDNFSVEGICKSLGKPLEHDFFINALKVYFPNAAERWSGGKYECLLEVSPALISTWIYEEDKPYRETWDFRNLFYQKVLM